MFNVNTETEIIELDREYLLELILSQIKYTRDVKEEINYLYQLKIVMEHDSLEEKINIYNQILLKFIELLEIDDIDEYDDLTILSNLENMVYCLYNFWVINRYTNIYDFISDYISSNQKNIIDNIKKTVLKQDISDYRKIENKSDNSKNSMISFNLVEELNDFFNNTELFNIETLLISNNNNEPERFDNYLLTKYNLYINDNIIREYFINIYNNPLLTTLLSVDLVTQLSQEKG